MISIKSLKLKKKIRRSEVKESILNGKSIYTISPTLFPRPSYWPENLQVLGYHERSIQSEWLPTKALEDFLSTSEKIVFITFGSMTNPTPDAITKIFIDACIDNGITAIFNTASGGLVEPKKYDRSQFHFIERVPYAWIFPKIYAVVHHGGSGTTHTALKYGCASMIIPHIIDQFAWSDIVAGKGAGPKGPSMGKLQKNIDKSSIVLKKLLSDLVTYPFYKENAISTGKRLKDESFQDLLVKRVLHEFTQAQ